MFRRPTILVLAALATTPAAALSPSSPASALAGRVAGTPRDCISSFESDQGGAIYNSGDLLYRGRGSRIYLNHPASCPFLRSDRRIVTRTPSTQQCRGDIFEVQDSNAPIGYGSCTLGSFVPYDRPRK